MAQEYFDTPEDEGSALAYDLRQALAKLLEKIKNKIEEARMERNYPLWFSLQDSLFIEISMKLTEKEQNEFNDKVKETMELVGVNPHCYTNSSNQSNKIYSALRNQDIWLNEKMEKYKLFGSKEMDEDGL